MSATIRKQVASQPQAAGDGTFWFVASTGDVDREGDIIRQNGWKLDQYVQNPIILFSHDHKTPIGRAVEVVVRRGCLMVRVEFAPEDVSASAAEIGRLVGAGYLKAVSVGFHALKMNPLPGGGTEYIEVELLEVSVVSVGANSSALIVARSASAHRDAIEEWVTKGGRVLSASNEQHLRAADAALCEVQTRISAVLSSQSSDDEIDITDDDTADDIDLEEVKSLLPDILTDLVSDLRHSAVAAVRRETARALGHDDPLPLDRVRRHHFDSGDEIDLDPATFATALRDVMPTIARQLRAEILHELPETISSAIRRTRGRLD